MILMRINITFILMAFSSLIFAQNNIINLYAKDDIFKAIEESDLEKVINLVKNNYDLETIGGDMEIDTPIEYSISLHENEIFDFLLLEIMKRNQYHLIVGDQFLNTVISSLNLYALKKIIDYQDQKYLEKKAGYILGSALSVFYLGKTFEDNDSKFFQAKRDGIEKEVAKYLFIDLKANIDAQSFEEKTGLHYCLSYPELVELFLHYRANPNIVDNERKTTCDHIVDMLLNPPILYFGSSETSLGEPQEELKTLNMLVQNGGQLSNGDAPWKYLLYQLVLENKKDVLNIILINIDEYSITLDNNEHDSISNAIRNCKDKEIRDIANTILEKVLKEK